MARRDTREWMRYRLGIRTPLEAGIPNSLPGDQPPWQADPSNVKMNSAIETACKVVNQHVHLSDSGSVRIIPIQGSTASGPLSIDLSGMPGFKPRSVNSIRRIWWVDGAGAQPQRLWPVTLDNQDQRGSTYEADPTGVPTMFAIEGYTLYLLPGPVTTGSINFMAGCGVLAPLDDDDSYDQLPSDYDPCVDYIGLVELGKMMPEDQAMTARAQAFTPDATAGLDRLKQWFFGGSNEQAQGEVMFDARYMRRYRIRR